MFDDYLRALKDRLLAPLARRLGGMVHPNAVTVIGFVVGMGSAGAGARGAYTLGLMLWLVNRFLDGFDGTVARASGRQSDFGGYLDIVLDFAVYAAIPIGFAIAAASRTTILAAVVLVGVFYVNAASWMYLAALLERRALGAAANGELTSVTMPPGLVAGTETAVAYTLFFIWPGHIVLLFGAMAVLVAATVAQRLVWAWRILR
ncbi:MAG TPA: CDP-alcohol phosphatidyltransferase family protein [Gemmatimonadaceae bacterium]|nr:CDP-alcohol phosphatidyltransferase family protein [Gemmatimonadaceae bacterium]